MPTTQERMMATLDRSEFPLQELASISATEAQKEFASLVDQARRLGEVVVTRHETPQVVVLSVDRYQALVRAAGNSLPVLTEEFNELLRRMQQPDVREATRLGLDASVDEMATAFQATARRSAL